MKIIHVSFVRVHGYKSPLQWLERLYFFTGTLESLAKKHEVISLHCIEESAEMRQSGVRYRFFKTSAVEFYLPVRIISFLNKEQPDAVVLHGLRHVWQNFLTGVFLPRRCLIFAQHHGEPALRRGRWLFRLADRFIHGYFFTASGIASDWNRKGLIALDKVFEVPGGSTHFARPVKDEAMRRFRTTGAQLVYIWVGRFNQNKDPDTLLKAFSRFARERLHVRLIVIFADKEVPDSTKKLADGVEDNIHWVGKVSHHALMQWYSISHFVVSTSHAESTGFAVIEAMACGCVPVVTDIPAFRMITGDGACGALYPAGDVAALLSALRRSTEFDLETMSTKALTRFETHLSFDAIATRMTDAIQAV